LLNDRRITLALNLAAFVIAIAGLVATGLSWGMLMFFTIWTNIVAAILFAVFAVRIMQDILRDGVTGPSSYYPRLTMVAATSLAMMGLAYWGLLAPNATSGLWTFDNLVTHAVTPLLLVIFYFALTRPGSIRPRDIGYAALLPLAYVLTVYAAYLLGYQYGYLSDGSIRWFPYFFLDFHNIGWGMVSLYILGIVVLVVGIGYLLLAIDRQRSRKANPSRR